MIKIKKNILILINRMTGAGPARVVSNLSLNLPNEKYKKYIVIYDSKNASYELDADEVIYLETKPSKNPLKRIYNTLKRIIILRKFKKEYNIDTTISLLPNPNLVNILSRVNDKVIISERSYMSKSLSGTHGKIYKALYRTLYNKSDLLVAVSKAVKEDLIKNFGVKRDKIKVIYNFYNIEQINKLSQEKLNNEEMEIFNNPTLINVGRIDDQKGQWHLIRAFEMVKKEHPNTQLVILGEDQGYLYDYLYGLTKELKVIENVHFLGFQRNPFKYLSKSTLFVFPSLYEGFPNALAEAMACGLPVISSDCTSGPREIISSTLKINEPVIKDIRYDEYGVLIPTADGKKYDSTDPLTQEERMLSESIIKMLEDDKLRKQYKNKSLARISEFHTNSIIKEWEDIL